MALILSVCAINGCQLLDTHLKHWALPPLSHLADPTAPATRLRRFYLPPTEIHPTMNSIFFATWHRKAGEGKHTMPEFPTGYKIPGKACWVSKVTHQIPLACWMPLAFTSQWGLVGVVREIPGWLSQGLTWQGDTATWLLPRTRGAEQTILRFCTLSCDEILTAVQVPIFQVTELKRKCVFVGGMPPPSWRAKSPCRAQR